MSNVDNTLFPLLKGILETTLLSWGIDLVAIGERVTHWFDLYWYLSIFLSAIFFAGIIYLANKVSEIRRFEYERVYGQRGLVEEIKEGLEIVPPKQNQDWEKILKLIGSENPNDWKLAVIEADKMLEVVVNTFAVPGENIGDKLKNIEASDFLTLNEAWQAHKVRNQIAHEHNFHLNQHDARLTIDNFEKVFREFDFI